MTSAEVSKKYNILGDIYEINKENWPSPTYKA